MWAALILVVVLAMAAGGWFVFRSTQRAEEPIEAAGSNAVERRPLLPAQGLLVSEDVLRTAGTSSDSIWEALEVATIPVALEYFPASEGELTKYRTVPVNAAAQQGLIRIVEALDPKGPTLFRVVLPKGAELVKAVGADGFRGFSRTGGNTVHAVLKPVAAGGAIAAGWPVFAVAGTVMAVDMVAQREQRAHQRRVVAALGRQDERYYRQRITDQRTADAQLSHAISLMLDGATPNMDLALKGAYDEFHSSQQFLDNHRGVISRLANAEGKVDYRQLERALGGDTKEVDHFVRELHLARSAVAIRRKALIADAAAVALADSGNPYTALRRYLDGQAQQLERAEADLIELSDQLMEVELTGPWHKSKKKLVGRQEGLRKQIVPATSEGQAEVRYLATASGEIYQLVGADDETEAQAPPPAE